MSTEENTEPEQEPEPKSLISRLGVSPIAFVITVVVAIVFMPTVVLMLGGMMPSLVAYILDDTRKKSKAKTIAYMNIAGCFIIGMELWTGDNSIDAAIGVFLQPVNWVIIYGMSLLGWVLIKCLDPFISSYLKLNYQLQQGNLRKRRKYLLEEWGEHVATVTADGDFIYDTNVYLDQDEVENDPDEQLDIIHEDEVKEESLLQIEDKSKTQE